MVTKKLPAIERYFYFLVWTFGIIYSLYHVFLVGNKLVHKLPKDYFTDGWSFVDRKKDISDDEWNLWMKLIQKTLPLWFVLHHTVSQIIRRVLLNSYCHVLPLWYFAVTSLCLLNIFPFQFYALFLIQPAIFFVFVSINYGPIITWTISFVIMSALGYSDHLWDKYEHFDREQIDILLVALLWQHLKCISFSLCDVKNKMSIDSFIFFMGYSFYLPTFFFGPIMLFEDFLPGMKRNLGGLKTLPTTLRLLLNNIRYLFWLYFTEFALHFIYVNALLHYITLFENKSVWLMYGLGYAMGQFFFHKYTIVYGLATTWTKAEGYQTPRPPVCVAHIHLYSDMWRYFDEGFYFFIKRYIYERHLKNLMQTTVWHKIKVSFGCFLFVYMWHGFFYNILLWTFLNFCGLTVEMLARHFSRSIAYSELQDIMGYENERRIKAFICAPLTVLSAISNFYFLGGTDVGNAYFKYLLRSSVSSMLCLWFFVYSLCQLSMELQPRSSKST